MHRRFLSAALMLLACQPLAAQLVPELPLATVEARHHFLDEHPGTGFSQVGTLVERVWGRAFSTGATPTASVQSFVDQHAGIWGATPSQLVLVGPFEDGRSLQPIFYDAATESYKFTGVYYSQQVAGIPVFRAHFAGLVRNEPGHPMVLASSSLRDVSAIEAELAAGKPPAIPDPVIYTRFALNQFRAPPRVSAPSLVIWAGIDDQVPQPKIAVRFDAEGGSPLDPSNHMHMLYVVDINDGTILYQESLIYHADVTGSVKANVTTGWKADHCGPTALAPLPYARVSSGAGTFFADVNGNFVIPWPGATSLQVTSTIAGAYFEVDNAAGAVMTITSTVPSGGTANFTHNLLDATSNDRAQVNAYLHANVARDAILEFNPSYPTISSQSGFPVVVNINDSCNAFYQASTINFFLSTGGCANTGFSTIVYHEFGHNMVDKAGSGQGPYGEGMSDCLAVLISDESVLAWGFHLNCFAGLRDADNTCQYVTSGCSTCGSSNHACGRLLSGCIWDLRNNLLATYPADYRERLGALIVNSVLLHVGTSSITPSITVDFLTLNDDNGDITDGTPDYLDINDAFEAHNMESPVALSPIKFTFPNGLPTLSLPDGTTTVAVNVEALSSTPVAGTGQLFYRFDGVGAFTSIAMTQGAPNEYTVALPAGTCGSAIDFYFAAQASGGGTVTHPAGAPASFLTRPVAYSSSVFWSDDFEADQGWQYGLPADTASAGDWLRGNPNGTAAQPENDHTAAPGADCAFTGQGSVGGSLGQADVDNGVTTLTSPSFDLDDVDDAYFTAWVWYSNDTGDNPGQDVLPVQVSNNGGTSWVTMQDINVSQAAWVQYSWRLQDYVALTGNMRVRFRAQDTNPQSLVEAAVDDAVIVTYACKPLVTGDLNGDGVVDGGDLAIVLGAWGPCSGCLADINDDGVVDGSDLAIVLGNWG